GDVTKSIRYPEASPARITVLPLDLLKSNLPLRCQHGRSGIDEGPSLSCLVGHFTYHLASQYTRSYVIDSSRAGRQNVDLYRFDLHSVAIVSHCRVRVGQDSNRPANGVARILNSLSRRNKHEQVTVCVILPASIPIIYISGRLIGQW